MLLTLKNGNQFTISQGIADKIADMLNDKSAVFFQVFFDTKGKFLALINLTEIAAITPE